jgi:multiple sugar transport system permease protein
MIPRLKTVKRSLFYVFVVSVVVFWAFPIFWVVLSSFKPDRAIISQRLILLFAPTLEHYRRIFETHDFFHFLMNSSIVAISTTIVVFVASFLGGYGLSRFKTGGFFLVFSIMLTRVAPPAAILMPYFLIFKNLGLNNTLTSLVIVNVAQNLSFMLLMLTSFIDEIPYSIEEAAKIEGASWFQTLYMLIFPLARPGIVTTSIFTFIFTWNEYLFAMVLSSSNRVKTLPVAAGDFITAYAVEWGPVFASGVVILLPIMVLSFFVQKYIVKGLTVGAVK